MQTTTTIKAETFPNDFLTNCLGEPQTISISFRPVDNQAPNISENFCIAHSSNVRYAAAHAVTSTSDGHVHSSFIIRSEPVDKACYLHYRFQHDDLVTIENREIVMKDFFSSKTDMVDIDELVDNYHLWMISCAIKKLKEDKYFSTLHQTDGIEFIAATEA